MTKVKICGLKTEEDVDIVNKIHPEYVGFVFAPSKRQISDGCARKLRGRISKEILTVGVFVNDEVDHIISLCESKVIDLVQLHGEESEEYVGMVQHMAHIPVIQAARLSSQELGRNLLGSRADYILYDAYVRRGGHGGTGKLIDTSFLPIFDRKIFLAGGLNAENVEWVVKRYRPYAVDVSSSVEVDGKKDYRRIKQFVDIVRGIGGNEE